MTENILIVVALLCWSTTAGLLVLDAANLHRAQRQAHDDYRRRWEPRP